MSQRTQPSLVVNTVGGGAKETVYLVAPVDGYVYHIHVAPGDQVESRLFVWMNIVEETERFTNLMEYQAGLDDDGNPVAVPPTQHMAIQILTDCWMESK